MNTCLRLQVSSEVPDILHDFLRPVRTHNTCMLAAASVKQPEGRGDESRKVGGLVIFETV